MKSNEITQNTRSFDELVMALPHSNRCTECQNTYKSIGNGFYTKKYIEAVLLVFIRLEKLAVLKSKFTFHIAKSKYKTYNFPF